MACKKHRNGSRHRKDLVMNEAIMRETIAFFLSKTKHYGQCWGRCARASSSVLNAHVFEGSNCKIFHSMSISIKKPIMFSDFLTHLEYVVVLLRFF